MNLLSKGQVITYMFKLSSLSILDQFDVFAVLFAIVTDVESVLDLQYPDIYGYLINFPSEKV